MTTWNNQIAFRRCGTALATAAILLVSVAASTIVWADDTTQTKYYLYVSKMALDQSNDWGALANAVNAKSEIHWYATNNYQSIASGSGPLTAKQASEISIRQVDSGTASYLRAQKWSQSNNTSVQVGLVYPPSAGVCNDQVTVNFSEQPRTSQLASDLGTILGGLPTTAAKTVGAAVVQPAACVGYDPRWPRVLDDDKANLAIEVTDSTSNFDGKINVITGYSVLDHVFLSGDIIVKSLNQVSYDQSTNSITEKTKGTPVFVGGNFQVGDIYTNSQSWTDNIVGKIMINAAAKPLDSVGIGVGYRIKQGDIFSKGNAQQGAVEIFVGEFRTAGLNGAPNKYEFRAGISFTSNAFSGLLGK